MRERLEVEVLGGGENNIGKTFMLCEKQIIFLTVESGVFFFSIYTKEFEGKGMKGYCKKGGKDGYVRIGDDVMKAMHVKI